MLLYHYLALRCVHNLEHTQLGTTWCFASVLQGSESAASSVSQLERMLGNVTLSYNVDIVAVCI